MEELKAELIKLIPAHQHIPFTDLWSASAETDPNRVKEAVDDLVKEGLVEIVYGRGFIRTVRS